MEWSARVKARRVAIRTSKLPIDEHRASGVLAAWTVRIRGNETVNQGFDGHCLVWCEILPTIRGNGVRWLRLLRHPGEFALQCCRLTRNGAAAQGHRQCGEYLPPIWVSRHDRTSRRTRTKRRREGKSSKGGFTIAG